MADLINGVKVYSDEMEVLDYIREELPPEIREVVLKKFDSDKDIDCIIPFHFDDKQRKYYAVLMRMAEIDDEGSLILLISKEKESIYAYFNVAIESVEEDYKHLLFYNKRTIREAFEEIDTQITNNNNGIASTSTKSS